MAHSARLVIALLHIFAGSFLDILEISNGQESDISCLRSIKESLQDPHNNFKFSWDFSNPTLGSICNFVGVDPIDCGKTDESRISSINLRSKGLKGHFPLGIKKCSSLTQLDLSGNELPGTIPNDIFKFLPSLSFLNLSSNNFTGKIPNSIVNCTYLSVLRLDNNQLTGLIPQEINQLQMLRDFCVANNLLSGPVPLFSYVHFPAGDFANNRGLCGAPLEPCMPSPKKFIVLIKEGFVVGWSVAMVSVVVVMLRNTLRLLVKKATTKKATIGGTQWCFTDERSKSMMISQMERMVTRMSFTEISEATGNFHTHNVIGLGKIGMMYKAVLPNCWPLAVKRLHNCQSYEEQFLSELSALGILRHDNLVPLLGYCCEQNEKLLVYKYILHGNLYDWLHVGEGEHKDKILEWPLRTKIAIGIARGLAWLHHKYEFRVVHLNLGSNSILLDKNFEPKISNFGGAKISSSGGVMFTNSNVINTRISSFVDSGVWELGFVKKDVYDFGILLLELITRKEPTEINSFSYGFNGSLFDWITHLLSNSSDIYSVIDNSLIGRGFDSEIFELLRIACICLNPFPSQRPTMLELYNTISTFGERDGITNDSEILMQPEIAIASSSIEINTISTFGESYGITNDSGILMQSEIAIASSSNEIVELEIAQTN